MLESTSFAPSCETDLATPTSVARQIGRDIAALHANDVDRDARFPMETLAALRQAGLMSALVPRELGGSELSLPDLAAVCTALGQSCSASAMIFAMHQIQVACVVRHALHVPLFQDWCRELVEHQMLVGSVTSEVGVGGDTRSSVCALEATGEMFTLAKDATTISYGAQAEDLLVTCRASPGAARSDQSIVLLRKGQFDLKQTSQWNTLGMRGTCSPGFRLTATAPISQIIPVPYAEVSSASMVPFSHVLWAAVWLGIATDAVARAASTVRSAARRNPGVVPPAALRLAEVSGALQALRSQVHEAVAYVDSLLRMPGNTEAIGTIGFALKMNHLKTSTSMAAVQVVQQALWVCGIQGYRNDSGVSIGRHLRDALSAPLMVANDRIHAQNASLLLVQKEM